MSPPPSARLAALPKIADAVCASGGSTADLGGFPVGAKDSKMSEVSASAMMHFEQPSRTNY